VKRARNELFLNLFRCFKLKWFNLKEIEFQCNMDACISALPTLHECSMPVEREREMKTMRFSSEDILRK